MRPSFSRSENPLDAGEDYESLDAAEGFDAAEGLDEVDAAESAASELETEGYDEGDAYDDSMGDEADLAEGEAAEDFDAEATAEDTFDEDAADESFETGTNAAASAWSAFESELADALDADGTDEFLGALLGGLSRAAGSLARSAGPAARSAGRLGGVAQAVGRLAGGAGRLADTGAVLARLLGQPGGARALRRAGAIAQGAGRVAGGVGSTLGALSNAPRHLRSVSRITGRAASHAHPIAELLAQIGRLSADGADEFEAFDTMAELYEDGIDAALPAAVGVAARLAARALGNRNLARMDPGARRAFVRAIAQAARHLVRGAGSEGVRALPRLAVAGVRNARAPGTAPGQVPARMRRTMTRAATAVVRQPGAVRRLARPLAAPARTLRPAGVGRGVPTITRGSSRRYVLQGPIELTIRPL